LIIVLAILAHFVVRWIKKFSQWLLSRELPAQDTQSINFTKRYPKTATLLTIIISALTFIIYFMAIGLILREFKISLTTYLASATVIGLAIGFGLQGMVQDIIIGLTLIFSDALNIGEMVETSGQIGRVESMGLRFTILTNLHGQLIYIPNRNISTISTFRNGCIRAFVDIQIPDEIDSTDYIPKINDIAKGMYQQYKPILRDTPENLGLMENKSGHWKYLRLKFRLWPGQTALIETTFKQRILTLMKTQFPEYADWMITVTYRTE